LDFLEQLHGTLSNLSRAIDGMDRIPLMAVAAISAAIAVGAVARNHEFGLLGKLALSVLLFAMLLAFGLAALHYGPAWVNIARMAPGLERP